MRERKHVVVQGRTFSAGSGQKVFLFEKRSIVVGPKRAVNFFPRG
jgi:hypothetical protein